FTTITVKSMSENPPKETIEQNNENKSVLFIDSTRKEEVRKKIAEAFEIFQSDNLLDVDDDLGRFVRSLGINPTNAQIEALRKELKKDYLQFGQLEPVISKILLTGVYNDELMIKHPEE